MMTEGAGGYRYEESDRFTPLVVSVPHAGTQVPEIDRPQDEEDDPEMEQPPEIVPEKPPPPAPWDRARPQAHGGRDEPGG